LIQLVKIARISIFEFRILNLYGLEKSNIYSKLNSRTKKPCGHYTAKLTTNLAAVYCFA